MPIQTTYNHNLPPAEQRVVSLWFQGKTTDKAAAQVLGQSPRSVGDSWQRLMMRLCLPPASRREHAIIELIDRGWITVKRTAALFLVGAVTFYVAGSPDNAQRIRRPNKLRRRDEYHQLISEGIAA